MKYRNTKTGAVIDVPSELGGNWVKIDAEPKKAPVVAPTIDEEEVKPKKTRKKTTTNK